MKKSFVAIFSAAAIAVSSLGSTIAYGSVFADINDVPWSGAVTYIDEAYSLGLMAGYVENNQRYCKPKNNVTYCEAVQLMYAIMSSHSGTSVNSSVVTKWTSTMAANNIPSWAYNAVAYALENSILTQNDISIFISSSSNQNYAKREDVAVIFGKALAKVYSLASNPTVSYADKDKVATTSVPYLELLNRLNIMVGDSNNNFNPKVNINRAEMSVLVTKAYNTLKGNTNTNTNTPSGAVTQYSGKVSEKTSSGSGYSITVTNSGKSNTFTTTSATKVTDANSKSTTVDKIGTGDSIVAVCSGGIATAIIIMSQNSESTNSVKGTINSVSTSKIAIISSGKTKEYKIDDEDITVTIDGSNSSLSSLVSKFKGSNNFSATVYLDSDDIVTKIVATKGKSSDGDYDDEAIKSITSSKIKLYGGDDIDLPDDTDDVTTVEIDGDYDYDFDDLEKKFKNLDDDEQMIVKDYTTKSGELRTIKVKIDDLDKSSSSSADGTGLVKSISSTKVKLNDGNSYDFPDDEDDVTMKFDGEKYTDLDDFVSDIDKKLDKDKSVYVEMTIKSKEITKITATTCKTVEDEEIEEINTSKKRITVDGDDYTYTSSTKVSVKDGNSSITSMSKLVTAIDDNGKTIEVTLVLDDDDNVIIVTGNVTEIEDALIKTYEHKSSASSSYIVLKSSSAKYYFTNSTDFNSKGDYTDRSDLDEAVNEDEEDVIVTITLDDDGKIDEIRADKD
ncbi:MAG: S-layer homology domain-containing protein [Candidatus Metalachnospira sp.]|nr:S-layer homology domain-containing protein [Candidatus Metalachnospira sp.]